MRSQHSIIQLLLAVCAAVSLAVASQAAQPQPSTADAWRGFAEKLSSGTFVAVALKSGERLEGHVLQVSAEGLYLTPKTRIAVPVRILPFDSIQSIELRKERMSPGARTLMWTGIGAGAFLLLLGLLVAAYGGN